MSRIFDLEEGALTGDLYSVVLVVSACRKARAILTEIRESRCLPPHLANDLDEFFETVAGG
jgi:hypothetical protein